MDNGLSDVPLLVITDDWLERGWFWDSHLFLSDTLPPNRLAPPLRRLEI